MIDPSQLSPGEEVLGEWRASVWVYLRKITFYSGITALVLVALGSAAGVRVENALLGIAAVPVCLAGYLLAFEDLGEWARHRDDHWVLTNRNLHFTNDQTMALPLTDIVAVQGWMVWALRLRLKSGLTTTVSFVANRQEMRRAIEEAIKDA